MIYHWFVRKQSAQNHKVVCSNSVSFNYICHTKIEDGDKKKIRHKRKNINKASTYLLNMKRKKFVQNFIKYKQEQGFLLPLTSFFKDVQVRQVVSFVSDVKREESTSDVRRIHQGQ